MRAEGEAHSAISAPWHSSTVGILAKHLDHRLSLTGRGDCLGLLFELQSWAPKIVRYTEEGGQIGQNLDVLWRAVKARREWMNDHIDADALIESGDIFLALGLQTAIGPNLIGERLYVLSELTEENDPNGARAKVAANIQRLEWMTGANFPSATECFELADHLRQSDVEFAWQFLCDSLPQSFRAGGNSEIEEGLGLLPKAVDSVSPGEPRFRLLNLMALGQHMLQDIDGAEKTLQRAERQLPHIDDAMTAGRLAALLHSNWARLLLGSIRLEDAYSHAICSLRAAPQLGAEWGALWFHAERACRIAQRLGTIDEFYAFLVRMVPSIPPTTFGDDPFYAYRKYSSFTKTVCIALAEAGMDDESRRILQESETVITTAMPDWQFS